MRKALLLIAVVLGSLAARSQCTPNLLYTDSVFGVWPDTITDFRPAFLGVFYSDTMNLLIPVDAELIDPNNPPLNIDSVHLASVQGLPPGLSISCNSHTSAPCTYLPSTLGCGLIEGTPTQTGVFDITLNVIAWFNFFGPQQYPASFAGYRIIVSENTTSIGERFTMELSNVRNVPNPFASRTNIEFQVNRAGEANIRVFNMVGEQVWVDRIQSKVGMNKIVFDSGDLPGGVYLYKVETGTNAFTGRMAIQR